MKAAQKIPPGRLLDVNVLLAAIWANHPQHEKAFAWIADKIIVLCPLAELGFLRISTHPKVINAPLAKARNLLDQFAKDRNAEWVSDDLRALESHTAKSDSVTDHYPADLAAKHNARLATFDVNIAHPAVVLIR
jgi:toxin-antitoxin system PIN domain toxin